MPGSELVRSSRGVSTDRTLVLEEQVRYDYREPVAELRQRLRIVPPASHGGQRRRRWQLVVNGVGSSRRRTFLDSFGNLTIDVRVPRVDEAVEFALDAEADIDPTAPSYEIDVDARYLRHTARTRPDDRLTEMAASAPGDDAETLCSLAHQSLSYEWGITGVHTTAAGALAGGRGVCQDYAHIMLALCRAVGLAARYVSGHLIGEGGSHAWVEVLRPHPDHPGSWLVEGWDPTNDRRTNVDYLVVAVGRDYADAAPLSGAYVGDDGGALTVCKRLDVSPTTPG